ncbi:MAG: hypothetical protein HY537_02850, partial [Deltaproteobacteria bacterium]|nr:hypothetical protein [Deltaproteobacteria bacterium]
MKNSPLIAIGIFFPLVIVLVYSPALTTTYLYHDDWSLFFWDRSSPLSHPITPMLFYEIGRPIGAMVYAALVYPIRDIAHGAFVRGFLLIILLFCCWVLWKIFQRLGVVKRVGRLPALMMIGTAFLTPTFQTYIGYISNGIDLIAVLLSLLAAEQMLRAEGKIYTACFLKAVFLEFLALATYPPAAMVPWIFLMIGFWDIREKSDKVFMNRNMVICASMGIA